MTFKRKIIPDSNYSTNFITKKRLHEDEIDFDQLRSYRLNRVKKELAKREFYEKPTAERKRKKNAGIKKHQKEMRDKILSGEMIPAAKVGQKHLKGKRQINKYKAQKRLTTLRDFNRR